MSFHVCASRGALPMEEHYSKTYIDYNESLHIRALSSLILGQSLCIRPKAHYSDSTPFPCYGIRTNACWHQVQTAPKFEHSVCIGTCNVHLKRTQSAAICMSDMLCCALFPGSEWCQWEGLLWIVATRDRKVEREVLDVSGLLSFE